VLVILITMFQRDQADREARFSRNCKLAVGFCTSDADFIRKAHARSATAMAGWLFVFCYRNAKDSQRFIAYEGQSGSKDRGDPEVV
jgi:hypothetical protein